MTQPVVKGYITSDYGYRTINKVKEFHPGLDISCTNQPAPIYCAVSGKIISLGWSDPVNKKSSFGLRVWIKITDKIYIVYGHMSLIDSDLKQGMEIHEGNQLGFMGNTGRSFGTHLHIECRSLPNIKGSHSTPECIEIINRIKNMYV